MFKSSSVYPVYFMGYQEKLNIINDYYSKYDQSFHLLGRSGQYNYVDQDQAMKIGFELADKIKRKK